MSSRTAFELSQQFPDSPLAGCAMLYVAVSVVIPLYNTSGRIEGAIRSALKQKPRPLEIIVVDDASTEPVDFDYLVAIDPCVRVIRHSRNLGGGVARNSGIDAARGELVAFLDADDRWLDQKLELQISQLEGRTTDNVFSCGNVMLDGNGDSKLYNSRPPFDGEDISNYFLASQCTFQTSTLILPTVLARSIRFDDRLRRHQDWDFVLRLLQNGAKYIYSHKPLAAYWSVTDPNRVSQQKSIEPSLFWLDEARNSITPYAAARFYFRTTFRNHFRQKPISAVCTAFRFTTRDWRFAIWVLTKIRSKL